MDRKKEPIRDDPSRSKRVSKKKLQFLSSREISIIDEMLAKVSPFGEVRLTVRKGRLRYVASTKSYDALKWDVKELE